MLRVLMVPLLVSAAASAFDPAERDESSRLLNEADSNYREMRAERAVQLYREYLARYADRADVRTWLGAALLNTGSIEEAAVEANRAIALDPNHAKAYVLKGRVLAAGEHWETASEAFGRALELDPRDTDAWYFAGRASCAAENFEKAIGQFRQAIQAGGVQSRIYVNLGAAYDSLGRENEAEAAYGRAINLAGSDYQPWFAYGVFLFKHRRAAESLPMLRKAFLIAPHPAEVRFEFGRALYQNEQLAEAAAVLEGAGESNDCRLPNLLSRVFRRQGKDADADRALQNWKTCNAASGAALFPSPAER